MHATGQVVSVAGARDDADLEKLEGALNTICGPSIVVHACTRAADDFNARFDARSRTYVYAIFTGAVADPWLGRTAWHHAGALDVDAMNEAAGHLLGRRDFSSFGRVPAPDASAQRTLYELSCSASGAIVRVRARADSFIQQMVRSLVGTLVSVVRGKRQPDSIPGVIAAADRSAAGVVAPPHGLCLVAVEYDSGWSRPFDPFQ